MAETFGQLIRRVRRAARLSLEVVADQLGVSIAFLSVVELDACSLQMSRWARLVEVLPALTIADLAHAQVDTRTVDVDASRLSPAARAEIEALLVENANAINHSATKRAA